MFLENCMLNWSGSFVFTTKIKGLASQFFIKLVPPAK